MFWLSRRLDSRKNISFLLDYSIGTFSIQLYF